MVIENLQKLQYLKRYIYRVFFDILSLRHFYLKKMDRPVISEDIVELSNSMENLVVLSAEGDNTENGEF